VEGYGQTSPAQFNPQLGGPVARPQVSTGPSNGQKDVGAVVAEVTALHSELSALESSVAELSGKLSTVLTAAAPEGRGGVPGMASYGSSELAQAVCQARSRINALRDMLNTLLVRVEI
jgi:hypothetical protein